MSYFSRKYISLNITTKDFPTLCVYLAILALIEFCCLCTTRNCLIGKLNSEPKGGVPTRIVCPSLAVASRPSVIAAILPVQSSVIVVPWALVSDLNSFTKSEPVELSKTCVAPMLLASSSRSGTRFIPMIVLRPFILDACHL
jgi:hypothetical protein